MYTVEDETFHEARSIIVTLARELDAQLAAGSRRPVDLHDLIRRATPDGVPEGSEADHVRGLAEKLQKSFPIGELFPRRRRS